MALTNVMGKITATALACADLRSIPVFIKRGTQISPPPAPKKPFTAPISTPKAEFISKLLLFFKKTHPFLNLGIVFTKKRVYNDYIYFL